MAVPLKLNPEMFVSRRPRHGIFRFNNRRLSKKSVALQRYFTYRHATPQRGIS